MKQAESMTALSIICLELITDDKWICTGQVEQNRFEFIHILVIQNWFVAVVFQAWDKACFGQEDESGFNYNTYRWYL